MASRSVYCICGEPYDSVRFMIQCDSCKDWYHGSCVNVKEHESTDIQKYHCVQCQEIVGPSIYREIKNFHRHDYGDSNADGKAVQSGTPMFVKELRSRHFKSADEIVVRLRGPQLSLPYLVQNGFKQPILVDSTLGLGIQMPSDSFTVSDVMDYVGAGYMLDVIDVSRQENFRMPMSEWVEYFNCPVRNKVYNVISLEFSKTRLSDLVRPPAIVQKLSWVENYWPRDSPTHSPFCPQVMKYCLMSAQDSYTDFHIDFGGTSVWYHILRGEKVFFLIAPTPANLALYEHWMASSNQSETFFGDQVDVCYQMSLGQGETLFIPTGWIHAVLTPTDSLVFGGNFLHALNIPLQLHIHEMEKRINTPEKYKFPTFETVHWFAAPHILQQLKDTNVSRRELGYLVSGAKALVSVLKIWSSDSQNHKHDDVPPGINVTKLIKDLQREVRVAEKGTGSKTPAVIPKKPPPRQKRKEIEKTETESEKNLALVSQFSLQPFLQQEIDIKTLLHHHPFALACGEMKRSGVYDFVDSDDDHLVVDENPQHPPPQTHPLRLRLSFGGREEGGGAKGGSATLDDLLAATGLTVDAPIKRGDDAVDDEREAIQGMLSMSKGAIRFPPPSAPYDEFEEQLKHAHSQGDYIYLGLEGSDDECHVFKPRGRNRRDEPWNPKAKLVPNCPKPERPVREGVRKEAIECGLAAAAAKLANLPPQKRQYLKKKSAIRKGESHKSKTPPPKAASSSVSKRPKKGFATAKQRLGKILKIHKMLY